MRFVDNVRGVVPLCVSVALACAAVSGCAGAPGAVESTGGAAGAGRGSGGLTTSGGTSGEGGAAGGSMATGGGAGTDSGTAGASGMAGAHGGAGRGGIGGMGGAAQGGASGTGPGVAGHAGAGSGGATGKGGAGAGGQGATGGVGALPAVTIWIAGDSTVMTYAEPNTQGNNMVSLYGWGQEIGQFFNNKVSISNQAIGGRSVAFFMWAVAQDSGGNYQCVDDQGTPQFQSSNGSKVNTSQWARILNGMKAGDFLLIQFGTNDETHTCPRYVSLPDFETDLGVMADAARARGATPIFVTPMGHRTFSGTTATNTLLPYANAMKEEAAKKAVEVEDLNLESEAYYTSAGSSYLAANIFDGGTTHFTQAGAVQMATLVVKEVRKNDGPLAAYLAK